MSGSFPENGEGAGAAGLPNGEGEGAMAAGATGLQNGEGEEAMADPTDMDWLLVPIPNGAWAGAPNGLGALGADGPALAKGIGVVEVVFDPPTGGPNGLGGAVVAAPPPPENGFGVFVAADIPSPENGLGTAPGATAVVPPEEEGAACCAASAPK